MRTTKVLSITLPAPMLKEARELAKQENRTMSELVREALRRYQREVLGRSEHAGASECRGGRGAQRRRCSASDPRVSAGTAGEAQVRGGGEAGRLTDRHAGTCAGGHRHQHFRLCISL